MRAPGKSAMMQEMPEKSSYVLHCRGRVIALIRPSATFSRAREKGKLPGVLARNYQTYLSNSVTR